MNRYKIETKKKNGYRYSNLKPKLKKNWKPILTSKLKLEKNQIWYYSLKPKPKM